MIDFVINLAFLLILPVFVFTAFRSRKQARRDAQLLEEAAKDISVSTSDLRETIAKLNELTKVKARGQKFFDVALPFRCDLDATFYEWISHSKETSRVGETSEAYASLLALVETIKEFRATNVWQEAHVSSWFAPRADWRSVALAIETITESHSRNEWQLQQDTVNAWKKFADLKPGSDITPRSAFFVFLLPERLRLLCH